MTDKELLATLKDYCWAHMGLKEVYQKVEELIEENAKLKEKLDGSEVALEEQVLEELIPGVKVVSKTELFDVEINKKYQIANIVLVPLLIFLFFVEMYAIYKGITLLIIVNAILMLFMTILSLVADLHSTKSVGTGQFDYDVEVDDTVSLNEFHRRFEFIYYDGKTYTIVKKK